MNNLKKDREFQLIYNSGRKSFGYYSLIFFKKNDQNLKRCGFVVSKKTGNAVCRNRLKRLFREYYRNEQGIYIDCTFMQCPCFSVRRSQKQHIFD